MWPLLWGLHLRKNCLRKRRHLSVARASIFTPQGRSHGKDALAKQAARFRNEDDDGPCRVAGSDGRIQGSERGPSHLVSGHPKPSSDGHYDQGGQLL